MSNRSQSTVSLRSRLEPHEPVVDSAQTEGPAIVSQAQSAFVVRSELVTPGVFSPDEVATKAQLHAVPYLYDSDDDREFRI